MGKIMKVMRRKENADLAMKVIGGLIIAAGAAYLIFGVRHCDAARFLVFCFCLGTGLKIMEED